MGRACSIHERDTCVRSLWKSLKREGCSWKLGLRQTITLMGIRYMLDAESEGNIVMSHVRCLVLDMIVVR